MWLKFKETCDTAALGQSCVYFLCAWLQPLADEVLIENMNNLQGKFWPNHEPVSTLGSPMYVLCFLLYVFKLIQLVEMKKGKI